jgi:hypothetical protein
MRTKQRKDPGMQLIAARPGAFNQIARALLRPDLYPPDEES